MGRLTNAIKALFSKNTTNAASASGARVPIVDVSGDPIGNTSMADLASVLGGMQMVNHIATNGDVVREISKPGVYLSVDGAGNNPSGGYFYIIAFPTHTAEFVLLAMRTAGGVLHDFYYGVTSKNSNIVTWTQLQNT